VVKLGRLLINNPIIASSGALGFGRGYVWERPLIFAGFIRPIELGAVITKTLTANRCVGNWRGWNPWQVLWPIRQGWVNALGITNRGLEWFISHEYPQVYRQNLIVSITDPDPLQIVKMVERLNSLDVLAVEINLSCPNTLGWIDLQRSPEVISEIFKQASLVSGHPLIAKIGYLAVPERERLSDALSRTNLDAIDMINSMPYQQLYPTTHSPLKYGGGVSGRQIRSYALEQVSWFAKHLEIPIIGGGGVSSINDVHEFLQAGAQAVSIGSAHILKPWISTKLVKRWQGELEKIIETQEPINP
jgi:dihydroorotate dehydrogenase (NAD+) catalytic subunit